MIASYSIGDTSKTHNKFLYVEEVPLPQVLQIQCFPGTLTLSLPII